MKHTNTRKIPYTMRIAGLFLAFLVAFTLTQPVAWAAAPTVTVKQGMSGTPVKQVQEQLVAKKYLDKADGKFGDKTVQALKKFQKDNHLTVDGVAGKDTIAKLFASSSSGSVSTSTLRFGMTGSSVKQVQQALVSKKYMTSADGKFGVVTLNAVKKFQKDQKLKSDGVVGSTTKAKLFGSSSSSSSSNSMREGSAGSAVSNLQTRLKDLGHFSGKVDGHFGPQTTAAVKAFQSSLGLKADGVVGSQTLSKLYSSAAPSALGEQIVNYAKTFLGVPYVWAKADPAVGFDCSGLVSYVFKHFNINVPRSTDGMESVGTAVSSLAQAKPGDILCFGIPTVSHVAIYVGNNQMIHAPQTGEVVRIETIHRDPAKTRIRRVIS